MITIGISIFYLASLLNATSVNQMNILELIRRAEKIFIGKVIAIQEGRVSAPGGGEIPCTIYTVSVQDPIKGVAANTISFKFVGSHNMEIRGNYGYKFEVPGMPNYKVNDEVLLFLNKESYLGLTVPLGLFQGSFNIFIDPNIGKKRVVNGSNNGGLFKGVKEKDLSFKQRLSQRERNLLKVHRGAFDYETFISLVKKLLQ